MGESTPPSLERLSPTPNGVAHQPTVYTPLVTHSDVDDDDGQNSTTSNDDNYVVVVGDGETPDTDVARAPTPTLTQLTSPTAGLSVPRVVEPELYPNGAAGQLAVQLPAEYDAFSLPLETKPELDGSYVLAPGCSAGMLDSKSDTNSVSLAACRICHMSGEEGEVLISPCRCSGTLKYIHSTCLKRWLEILTKKSRKPPKCELCHFQYSRHKKFKFHHWRFPRVSRQDKILHIIFIINLVMMVGCAVATVMSFLSDESSLKHNPPGNNVELSTEEIVTLSCGVLFFVSFFVAMSVQIKAKHTIYQLLVKFIMQNMEWEIDEYDKTKDSLYKDLYKGLPVYV